MPTYEYQCKGCGHRFDAVHRISDPAPANCPMCGEGPIQKIFTSVGIIFKGSGFHVNDYRKSGEKIADAPVAADSSEKPGEKPSEKPADSDGKPAEPTPAPSQPAPAAKPDPKPAASPAASGPK